MYRSDRSFPKIVRIVSGFLLFTLLLTLFGSSTAPLTSSSAQPSSPFENVLDSLVDPGIVEAGDVAPTDIATTIGTLTFAPFGNDDGDPITNPTADAPAPVLFARVNGEEANTGVITLLVDALPDDASINPAGTIIEAQAWHADDPTKELMAQSTGRVDGYGAAVIMLTLPDTSATYEYQISAPRWNASEVRQVRFDQSQHSLEYLSGDLTLQTSQREDGLTRITFDSPADLDQQLGSNRISMMYLPTGTPDIEMLLPMPEVVALHVGPRTAQAELFLIPGTYMIMAEAQNGDTTRYSEVQLLEVAPYEMPLIDYVELREPFDQTQDIVRFRTPEGDLGYGLWSMNQGPQPEPVEEEEMPSLFEIDGAELIEHNRLDAWTWEVVTTTMSVDIEVDDGKKRGHLVGMEYDPRVRTYSFAFELLQDHAVTDTLTVQVFGKNDVLLYEEKQEVVLQPDELFEHTVKVPAELGEPAGIRVRLDDPFSSLLSAAERVASIALEWRDIAVQYGDLRAYVGIAIKALNYDIFTYKFSCSILQLGDCKGKATGLLAGKGGDLGNFLSVLTAWVNEKVLPALNMDKVRKEMGVVVPLAEAGPIFGFELSLKYEIEADCEEHKEAGIKLVRSIADQANIKLEKANTKLKDITKPLERKFPAKGAIGIPYVSFDLLFVAGGLGVRFSMGMAFKLKADASTPSDSLKFGAKLTGVLEGTYKMELVVYLFIKAFWANDFAKEITSAARLMESLSQLTLVMASIINVWEAYQGLDNFTNDDYCPSTPTPTPSPTATPTISPTVSPTISPTISPTPGPSPTPKPKPSPTPEPIDPPPPPGNPDDRLDAWQGGDLISQRLGIAGDKQTLLDQLQRAERLGLDLAVIALKRDLAALASYAEGSSKESVVSEIAEYEAAYQSFVEDIEGLKDGTIPIEAGQTITDAMVLRYNELGDDLLTLPTRVRLRELAENYEFAQARYQGLRGRELELQRQLDLLLRSGTIGVINGGMVDWTLGAIGTFGMHAVVVNPVPSIAGTLNSGRAIKPADAPLVLIVPTGALYRFGRSPQLREWLETYTKSGGTLITLAQYHNDDWRMLPGGEVRGLGYENDIFCQEESVDIVGASPYLDIFGKQRPDLQIDGSFTAFPSSASILLMRRTGNKMPAMIEYPFGNGKVIATAAFPDFYMNGLQSNDDVHFARNLFGLAFLQATNDQPIVEVELGEPVTFDLPYENTTAHSFDQLLLRSDYYNEGVVHAWRWKVHESYRTRATYVDVPETLPGERGTVQVTMPLRRPEPGLYRSAYSPSVEDAGTLTGPFYRIVDSSLFPTGMHLSSDDQDYYAGEVAEVTVAVENKATTERTLTLVPVHGVSAAPQTLTLPAGETKRVTYQVTMQDFTRVEMLLREGDQDLIRQSLPLNLKPLQLAFPIAQTDIAAEQAYDLPLNLTGYGYVPGTPLHVTALVNDQPIASQELVLEGESRLQTSASSSITLPAQPANTEIVLRAEVTGGTNAEAILTTRPSVRIRTVVPERPLVLGTTQSMAWVSLESVSEKLTANVVAQLLVDGTPLVTGTPVQVEIEPYINTALELPLAVPATLPTGSYDLLVKLTREGGSESIDESIVRLARRPTPAVWVQPDTTDVRQKMEVLVDWGTSYFVPPVQPLNLTLQLRRDESTAATLTATPTRNALTDTASFEVPSLQEGGRYYLVVTHPALPGWSKQVAFYVVPHSFGLANANTETTYKAGATGPVVIENRGGVDTSLAGTLELQDGKGTTMHSQPLNVSITKRASATADLAVPLNLVGGEYRLIATGKDHLGKAVTLKQTITIKGRDLELTSTTDKPAYLVGNTMNAENLLEGSGPLTGLTLKLRVLKETALRPIWSGELGTGGWSAAAETDTSTSIGDLSPASWSLDSREDALPALAMSNAVIAVKDGATDSVERYSVTDGSQQWSTDLDGDVAELVGNGSVVVARIGSSHLVALDINDGLPLWRLDGSFSELLASDDAIVARDGDYYAYDPYTGGEMMSVSASEALLVDEILLALDGSGTIYGYDVYDGTQEWSYNFTASDWLIAANSNYVVSFTSGAGWGSEPGFLVLDPEDGSERDIINISFTPEPDSDTLFVLHGNYLDYVEEIGGSGVSNDEIYRVDLSGSDIDTLEDGSNNYDISSPVGVNDDLFFVDTNGQQLVEIETEGAPAENDFGLGWSSTTMLGVSAYGLLVGNHDTNTLYSLDSGDALYSDLPGDNVEVLREDSIALPTSDAPQTITQLLTDATAQDLNDNEKARGRLWLEGKLYSDLPTSESDPTRRQLMDSSYYPFTIGYGTGALQLEPLQTPVRTDNPDSTLDNDASAIQLRGRIVNTSGLAATNVTIKVTGPDGEVYNQTVPSLAADAEYEFTTAIERSTSSGKRVYQAEVDLGGSTFLASALVEVETPAAVTLAASLEPTEVLSGEVAVLGVTATNPDEFPAVLTIDLGDGSKAYTLAGGETQFYSRNISATKPGKLTLPIKVTGDAALNESLVLTVHDSRASVAIASLPTTTPLGTAIQAVIKATSTAPVALDTPVRWSVTQGTQEVRSGNETLTTRPNDSATATLDLGTLDGGSYTLTVETLDPDSGTVVATTSGTFSVVAPQLEVTLDGHLGPVAGIRRSLTLTSTNSSASDLAWQGTLRVEGSVNQNKALALAPGENDLLTLDLPLLGPVTTQVVTATLYGSDGLPVASESFRYEPLAQPVQVEIVSLTADATSAGSTASVRLTLNNPGATGRALVELQGFDTIIQRTITLPPGQTTLTLPLPVPEDVLTGAYPVTVKVNGAERILDLEVSAYEIAMGTSLDKNLYSYVEPADAQPRLLPNDAFAPAQASSEGDTKAMLTVALQEDAGVGGTFELRVRYHDTELKRDVTLQPNEQRDEVFELPLRPWTERASVILLPKYGDGSYGRVLLIDTRLVVTAEDPRVTLTSDKPTYQPGETVKLTLEVSAPIGGATVMGPVELMGIAEEALVWLGMDQAEPLSGTHQFEMTLPQTMAKGRYHFRYTYDGEDRLLPIDVMGIELLPGPLALDRARYRPQQAFEVTVPIVNKGDDARDVIVYAMLNANGGGYQVTAPVEVTLPPGRSTVLLDGQLPDTETGVHQLIVRIHDPETMNYLAGDAIALEVGAANIIALATDQGDYERNGDAQATLDLYGNGVTTVQVTTSDGTVVYEDTPTLDGFTSVSFPVSTGEYGTEILDATLTGAEGGVSTYRAFYGVRAPVDDVPPELAVTSPVTDTPLLASLPMTLTLEGTASDKSGIAAVTVNGTVANLDGDTWSAELPERGSAGYGPQTFVVSAVDNKGNRTTVLHEVHIEPKARSAVLELSHNKVLVGGLVTSTLTLQSSGILTDYQMLDGTGLLSATLEHMEATSGVVTETGGIAQWRGIVTPGEPVVITLVTRQHETGTTMRRALLSMGLGEFELTNEEELTVVATAEELDEEPDGSTPSTTDNRLYLPVILSPQTLE